MNNFINMLLSSMFPISGKYSNDNFDIEYSMDKDVNDCLLLIYFCMLENNQIKQDELWNKFVKIYDKLPNDKQEYIKKDILKILKAQNENSREKNKKKEIDKYE